MPLRYTPRVHWLQTLDADLFRFLNQSLINPVFDRIMPWLSGAGWFNGFVLLCVGAGGAVLWRGNARARVCTLMIAAVVAFGDPLVCNTIKRATARPRPFVQMPEARTLVARPGSGSMPSSHAANWFAATLVAFLYYRRSARFMVPLAAGVAFSRVYNGVHYPSDALAGAILGAGYAVALVIALDAAWRWAGQKWFPLWWERFPSLLELDALAPKPESEAQDSRLKTQDSRLKAPDISTRRTAGSALETHWIRAGYVLIGVLLLARWLYLASGTIELTKDEAYQWLWSKHLALSYYSKPAGIAFLQFLGTSLWGDTEFGVRFFSPLFAAILSWITLRFLAREMGARLAFGLLLAVTATPLLGLGTILMTIDPPLVLCWMWAVIAGWRAVRADGRARHWLVVGLAMGLGFLCKYSALYQLICWAIFFALWPPARPHLRRAGPWLALLVFLLCTTPVIVWNAQHHWITVRHVADGADLFKPGPASATAGVTGPFKDSLRYFLDFSLAEAGLLNPVFFVGALWAMAGFWKRRREHPLWIYLFCMGAPVFLGHWLYSLHSRILPNWIAPAVVPMFCLMAGWWDARWRAGARWVKPFFVAGVALGLLAVLLMHQSNLIAKLAGRPLPAEMDPSRRARAWRETAAVVESARENLEREGKPAFIIADHYGMAGEFSFYVPEARAAATAEPLVYCQSSAVPGNQFFFWPGYRGSRTGQDAIFVSELDPYPLERRWLWKWLTRRPVGHAAVPPPPTPKSPVFSEFKSVTDLGVREIKLGNRVFRRVHLWECRNLR